MKFKIRQPELARLVKLGQAVAEKKTTMPILSNFLLVVKDGCLAITASDLEITLYQEIPIVEGSPGAICVNAKVFTDGICELPEKQLVVSLTDRNRLIVECETTCLKFVGNSADEFPTPPGIEHPATHVIDGDLFQQMVKKTVFAALVDETRFNLNVVCMLSLEDESAIRMVATDGHRLALATRQLEGFSLQAPILVPRKGILELRNLLGDELSGAEIRIAVCEGFLLLETKSAKLVVRLIDSEFPDYQHVIPSGAADLAVLDNAEFSQALKRVMLVVPDKGKGAKFHFEGSTLQISASSAELGDAEDEIPIKYNGAPLTVGFNARYLFELAQAYSDCNTLNIELRGPFSAMRVYGENDRDYMTVVMPMRLD